MFRLARPMARLLALLLLVQWGSGWPAHSRAVAALGEATVICSPEGMRTVHLGPDGQPVEPADRALACCLLCPGPAGGAGLAPPPVLPPPVEMAAPDLVMAATARALSFRPPPRTHHSRAPPIA